MNPNGAYIYIRGGFGNGPYRAMKIKIYTQTNL